MLGNLNSILKMVGRHLKILGKDMTGAVSALNITWVALWNMD